LNHGSRSTSAPLQTVPSLLVRWDHPSRLNEHRTLSDPLHRKMTLEEFRADLARMDQPCQGPGTCSHPQVCNVCIPPSRSTSFAGLLAIDTRSTRAVMPPADQSTTVPFVGHPSVSAVVVSTTASNAVDSRSSSDASLWTPCSGEPHPPERSISRPYVQSTLSDTTASTEYTDFATPPALTMAPQLPVERQLTVVLKRKQSESVRPRLHTPRDARVIRTTCIVLTMVVSLFCRCP
jgi:hypothetical protein